MMDYVKRFFESVFPNPTYRAVVIPLTIVILVLALLLVLPTISPRRFNKLREQRANLVLGIVIVTLLLVVMAVSIPHRWQWVVGLLPTLMVGYQLFFLWLYHPREIERPDAIDTGKLELREQSHRRAQENINSNFSLRTLFTRYGLPAVLLGITGIVLSDVLVDPQNFFSVTNAITDQKIAMMILRGLRLGAVGAYVYVLLELGRRTFRHDVTGSVAMWCWVTLILGPVLAATVAFLWRMDDAPNTTGWWGSGVVLFFTGFAPRRVIAAIEQAAAQLLKAGTPTVVDTRLIPLSKIRGIGPQIEERLSEEGIVDVNSLAAAEPVRLVRNTSFDMRQILTWIDEAILIVTLPRGWEALEEEGITGAIDLAWYYDKIIDAQTDSPPEDVPEQIKKLATKAKFDDPANLVSTIQRLSEDAQVQYIWTLYNNFTEYSGSDREQLNGESWGESNSDHQSEVMGDSV